MPLMQFLKGTFVQQTVATTLLLTFAEHIRPTLCLKANFQTCTRDLIKEQSYKLSGNLSKVVLRRIESFHPTSR